MVSLELLELKAAEASSIWKVVHSQKVFIPFGNGGPHDTCDEAELIMSHRRSLP
jgi:hypothetical protein